MSYNTTFVLYLEESFGHVNAKMESAGVENKLTLAETKL